MHSLVYHSYGRNATFFNFSLTYQKFRHCENDEKLTEN